MSQTRANGRATASATCPAHARQATTPTAVRRRSRPPHLSPGAGFASLKYYGAGMASDVILDGGIGNDATANHMWFLNTKYMMFRPHADRNFVPIGGERQAVNQDAIVKLIGFAGNLTSSGPQFCGVLIA